jgi:PAS domain-containing protein
VFSTQLFFGVLATTGMVLASGLAEQQHAQKKLRESEFRYRNLFNGMMEGFALCEMRYKDGKAVDFKYLQVNEAFQKLTGLADVAGKWVSEVIPGLRESNPGLLEVYGRVASTGKPERFEEYLATARPDRNGSGARPNAKGIFAKHIAHPHLGVGSIRATPATQGWFLRRSRNDREQTAHRRGADHVIRPRHQRAQAGR